jgi:hypothetical protein
MTTKIKCCFMGCSNDAEYEIRDGNTVDDYTYSCIEHVGYLLTDKQATVTHVG